MSCFTGLSKGAQDYLHEKIKSYGEGNEKELQLRAVREFKNETANHLADLHKQIGNEKFTQKEKSENKISNTSTQAISTETGVNQNSQSTSSGNKETPIKPPVDNEGGSQEVEGNKTGIKKTVSRETRTALELPKVELPKIGTDTERIAAGKQAVDKGEINPQDVVNKILEGKGKVGMQPLETSAMQYYMHQLGRADDLVQEQLSLNLEPSERANLIGQRQQLSDLMDAATEANMLAGTAWSDVGNTRQILIDNSFNPSREKAIIKDAFGGEVPQEFQLKVDAALKERDAAIEQLKKTEELLRQKEAESKVAQMKGQSTPRSKQDFAKKRKSLIEDLKKAKEEAEQKLKDRGIHKQGVSFTLDGKMIKIIGDLAKTYVDEGVQKIEEIVSKIHDEVKGLLIGIDKKDIRDAIALHEASKLDTKAENLETKIDDNNEKFQPSKLKLKFQRNTDWIKANQRVVNAEFKMKLLKRKAFESQKNMFQRGLMWAGRLTRLSVLSGYNVLYKLAAAATIGGAGKRIPEQAIGAIYSQIFKGIANKAPIEGFINAEAEAKFYKEFFNPKKFVHNSWEILKTGSSDLTKKHSGGEYEHVPVLYLPTDLHQIIKDPVKRATFEASMVNQFKWAAKHGLDINDPLVINSLENSAYKRANYEIFQEQNWLSRKFTAWKNQMEKSGNLGATGKFVADFMIPVSTVPTNIVRRVITTSPLGLIRGGIKVTEAYRHGIENLTNEQADAVMKQLKQGTLGTALWLIGWFGASGFGGLYSKYNPDKKRKEGELAHDEMEVGGTMLPKPVQHALPLEIIQFAATAKHVYDNYVDNKSSSTFEAAYSAAMSAIGAGLEQIPVVETGVHVIGAFNNPYEAEKLKEDVKRRFEPQILRETGVISKDRTKTGGGSGANGQFKQPSQPKQKTIAH